MIGIPVPFAVYYKIWEISIMTLVAFLRLNVRFPQALLRVSFFLKQFLDAATNVITDIVGK